MNPTIPATIITSACILVSVWLAHRWQRRRQRTAGNPSLNDLTNAQRRQCRARRRTTAGKLWDTLSTALVGTLFLHLLCAGFLVLYLALFVALGGPADEWVMLPRLLLAFGSPWSGVLGVVGGIAHGWMNGFTWPWDWAVRKR